MTPLALTMGDPAGIGGELSLRAWQALRHAGPGFVLLDDPDRLHRLAAALRLDVPIAPIDTPAAAPGTFPPGPAGAAGAPRRAGPARATRTRRTPRR